MLTVSNLPPATEEETREAFLTRVEEFEAANPDIDVEPSEYEWDVATFAAQMAGGTLPTSSRSRSRRPRTRRAR